jgi:2-haloacid dehalogenase
METFKKLPDTKAIVFDAYGTLFDISTIDERLRYHYGHKAAEVGPVWRQKQLEYTWLRTLMGRYKDFYALTTDALRFACEQTGAAYNDRIAGDLMEHYLRLRVYPEVRAALEKLQTGFRLAILSNANSDLLLGAVEYNDISRYLQAVLSVDELKVFKPSPGVYRLAEARLELPKEQILFVSSNTWDVAGAASYGLRVVWVKRREQPVEQLGFEPELVVRDVEELADCF